MSACGDEVNNQIFLTPHTIRVSQYELFLVPVWPKLITNCKYNALQGRQALTVIIIYIIPGNYYYICVCMRASVMEITHTSRK